MTRRVCLVPDVLTNRSHINARFQPRRRLVTLAAVGCKSLLDGIDSTTVYYLRIPNCCMKDSMSK